MNIRKATAADATVVAGLSGQLGYPVNADVMAARLGRILQRDDHVVFVAEETEVLGWIHVAEQEILETGRLAEVWGLVVSDQHRRRGIGGRLIEAAEAWTRARGLEQISLRSNVIRPESHPFYERLGFTRYKTQHAYRKRLALPES